MTATSVLNPHPPEFERFLYASVGEDRNGYVVTVLSALARLELDPWNETAELVTMGRDAARARLDLLLSRFRDVPALGGDHGAVARKLSLLLPEGRLRRAAAAGGSVESKRKLLSSGAIWAALAIILIVVQMMVTGAPGSGE